MFPEFFIKSFFYRAVLVAGLVAIPQIANAENNQATHTITMIDFFQSLPDGDRIILGIKDTGHKAKLPTIRFATATGVQWWKAISLSGKDNDSERKILCEDADNHALKVKQHYCEYQLQPGDLENNFLVLSKAGQSGQRTDIYKLIGAKASMLAGHIYTFLWAID